ncbi:MAG: Hypothetical transmembrane protein coupled to NADH-ubiquinone oxidoreductase chain 5 homolog, partial [uncultured Solirubrobacteraceae bacterium]
ERGRAARGAAGRLRGADARRRLGAGPARVGPRAQRRLRGRPAHDDPRPRPRAPGVPALLRPRGGRRRDRPGDDPHRAARRRPVDQRAVPALHDRPRGARRGRQDRPQRRRRARGRLRHGRRPADRAAQAVVLRRRPRLPRAAAHPLRRPGAARPDRRARRAQRDPAPLLRRRLGRARGARRARGPADAAARRGVAGVGAGGRRARGGDGM